MTRLGGPGVDAVRTVLMTEWNPIGAGVPNDEYDDYISGILKLMKAKVSTHELAAHLHKIESVDMCLEPSPDTNLRVAEMLLRIPI